MKRLFTWDILAALLVLVGSLWLIFIAIPSDIAPTTFQEISPRFFPNVLAVLIALLSLFVLYQEWRESKRKDRDQLFKDWGGRQWQVLGITAAIVASVWLITVMGFYIIAPLIMVGLFLCLDVRNWAKIIGICIGFMVLIYFLFEKGLHVELPRGFL